MVAELGIQFALLLGLAAKPFPGDLPQCPGQITIESASARDAPRFPTNGLVTTVGNRIVLISNVSFRGTRSLGAIYDLEKGAWTPISTDGWGDAPVRAVRAGSGVLGKWQAIYRYLDLETGQWTGDRVPGDPGAATIVRSPTATVLAGIPVRELSADRYVFLIPEKDRARPAGTEVPATAAFDANDRKWHPIAAPPISWDRAGATIAASDRWLVIWSGHRVEQIRRTEADGGPWAKLVRQRGPVTQTRHVPLSDGAVFDMEGKQWRPIPPGPAPRSGARAWIQGDHLVVQWGERYRPPGSKLSLDNSRDVRLLTDLHRLDLQTLKWQEITPRKRPGSSWHVDSSNPIMVNGEIFDWAAGTWRALPRVPAGQHPFQLKLRRQDGTLVFTDPAIPGRVGAHWLSIDPAKGTACYWRLPSTPESDLSNHLALGFGDNGIFAWKSPEQMEKTFTVGGMTEKEEWFTPSDAKILRVGSID